jgi:C4-dicarboxylate-specific signal transduction histidine kinase
LILFFTTKPVGSGTGLGLSINLQDNYRDLPKGSIHAESKAGEGTVFKISIPKYRSMGRVIYRKVKNKFID